MRALIPVFYRSLRAESQMEPAVPRVDLSHLCCRAHALGYELVPFNGYDPSERPTAIEQARRDENRDRLMDICRTDSYHVAADLFEMWQDTPSLSERLAAAGYPPL